MSHASMYLYLDPICVNVGEVDLQGYMYNLILLLLLVIVDTKAAPVLYIVGQQYSC